MQTPYDTLLRLRQREMDDMRIAINVQVNQLVSIENQHDVVNAALAQAQQVGTTDILMNTQAYMARIRAERDAVVKDRAAAGADLARLRASAVEAYGALRATRSAAEDYRGELQKLIAKADQLLLDDLSAARGHRPGRG